MNVEAFFDDVELRIGDVIRAEVDSLRKRLIQVSTQEIFPTPLSSNCSLHTDRAWPGVWKYSSSKYQFGKSLLIHWKKNKNKNPILEGMRSLGGNFKEKIWLQFGQIWIICTAKYICSPKFAECSTISISNRLRRIRKINSRAWHTKRRKRKIKRAIHATQTHIGKINGWGQPSQSPSSRHQVIVVSANCQCASLWRLWCRPYDHLGQLSTDEEVPQSPHQASNRCRIILIPVPRLCFLFVEGRCVSYVAIPRAVHWVLMFCECLVLSSQWWPNARLIHSFLTNYSQNWRRKWWRK